ncbi:unnamed protein product [Peronospora farinosa]|nr:unnamed protein product [Peronospora farinosa]
MKQSMQSITSFANLEFSIEEATVHGVAPSFKERPVGVGTIVFETFVDGKTAVIDDVLFVPGVINLPLSMGPAIDDNLRSSGTRTRTDLQFEG